MTDPKKHDGGGCAYPVTFEKGYVNHGMSMWDAAALATLQGLMADPLGSGIKPSSLVNIVCDTADLFICERKKRMARE